jgi:hypothetical protein
MADPEAIDESATLTWVWFGLEPADVRHLADRYGTIVPRPARDTIDQAVVTAGRVRALPGGTTTRECALNDEVIEVPGTTRHVRLRTSDAAWNVEVRRFGERWVSVGTGPPAEVLVVTLEPSPSPEPWQLRVPRSCVLDVVPA